jgi:FkbM family methyltransferase
VKNKNPRLQHRLYAAAHDVGERWHRALAGRPVAARAYFRALSLLRRAPDGRYKQRVLNSIASTQWLDPELPFQEVRVGKRTRIRLRPHPGEFDMRALLDPQLAYEDVVFEWLESAVSAYDTIIEVGANVGVYTAFFGKHQQPSARASRPRIVAFEPSAEACHRLQENLRANRVSAEVHQCAVAERAGVVEFFEPAGHLTNGSLDAAFAGLFSGNVAVRRVVAVDGAMVTRLIGDAPGRCLLKIDVEAAESRVLRSLRGFVEAQAPDILIEVLPEFVAELNSVDFLRAAGYRFYLIGSGTLTETDGFEGNATARDMLLTRADWNRS